MFTRSGATALYSVKFFQPDSAGNRGVPLLVDAGTRKVVSTQLLRFGPEALIMSPDGLTAYLIGEGRIVYYDSLSGTADLTDSFGFIGPTNTVLVHPDGTRVFWDQGLQLGVFDLSTRKVTMQLKYNLPNGSSAASVEMSQDGSTIYVTDGKGNVVVVGTRYGKLVATYKTAATASGVFPAPAIY